MNEKALVIDSETKMKKEYRSSFDVFKSNVCHKVKDYGDMNFIILILESGIIEDLYKKKWYPESLYLLGMVDYLCRVNDLPLCTNYNSIRQKKLNKTIYPSGILLQAAVTKDTSIKKDAKKNAIPEFLRFNIVENEVRNIV